MPKASISSSARTRVVELQQQADPPQADLHAELGVVRALAELLSLDRERQPARDRVGAPDGDESLGQRERERAVGEHAMGRRAARRLAAVDRPRERERLVDEALAALALRRPVQGQRELHAQAAAQRVDARAAEHLVGRERVDPGERLLERRHELGLEQAGRERAERAAERGLREPLGIVEAAGVLGRGAQRAPRAVDVAGAHARLAESLRELPGARLVGRQRRGDVDRMLVQPRRLLVGELADRAQGGARRVVDGALGAALGRGLQEVVGDLGEVRLEIVAVGELERLGREAMQLRAARRAEALDERVANERVGEREAARDRR